MPDAASTIRMAVKADLPAVQRCAEDAYAMYVPRIGKKPAPMIADFAAQIDAGDVYVSVEEDVVLGYIVMYPRDDHIHIENVAVFGTAQGKGIGKQLLAFAESRAQDAGIGALELYTNQHMTENLVFYPRLGFAEVGRGEEGGFSRVFYRKILV